MCEFISWIETDGQIVFLTNADLKGKRFAEYKKYNPLWKQDVMGHGAIRWFYNIPCDIGKNRECIDFSTPDNFPAEIVKELLSGNMTRLTANGEHPEGLLTPEAWAEYKKAKNQAWAKCNKVANKSFWSLFANPKNRVEAWRGQ